MRAMLTGVLLVAALVSVPTTRADEPINRADLLKSSNNLKQIALAFHNHHDTFMKFPGDILDKDGKPLLSWRVAILPFIEQDALYKQFKLDEPWDSENNKKLIEKMPKLYAPLRVKAKEGETFYQTFTGEGTLFVKGKALKITEITDGTSNTGLVFEAGEPVIWSKPQDMAFDAKKPLPKLGGMFGGISNVAMCDGSVRRLGANADEDELKKLIMPADGGAIDFKKLEK